MTFEELEKKATKAPWRVCSGFCLETRGHRYIAQFDASELPHRARENAVLAAHCRNNFALALVTLRRAIASCNSENETKFLNEMLAVLETVEEGVKA